MRQIGAAALPFSRGSSRLWRPAGAVGAPRPGATDWSTASRRRFGCGPRGLLDGALAAGWLSAKRHGCRGRRLILPPGDRAVANNHTHSRLTSGTNLPSSFTPTLKVRSLLAPYNGSWMRDPASLLLSSEGIHLHWYLMFRASPRAASRRMWINKLCLRARHRLKARQTAMLSPNSKDRQLCPMRLWATRDPTFTTLRASRIRISSGYCHAPWLAPHFPHEEKRSYLRKVPTGVPSHLLYDGFLNPGPPLP